MTTEALPRDLTADFGTASPANTEVTPRNRLVIYLLLVSSFVVILNETIMSVAIPHLMVDLGVEVTAAQWLTTAFLLTMAVVIPITGFLIQRLNTRPIFMIAMSLFTAGTLICAASPSLWPLVFGRVIQASGTAIMMPLLMTTVMTLVPPAGRGKMMGNISIVISVAPALGPTISGLILEWLNWRWMFILVVPIALAAMALGFSKIENVTTPRYAPLDIASVILSALGFGGVVYGLSSLGEASSDASMIPSWLPLAIGVVAIVSFVFRQLSLQKTDRALLDLRTFKSSNFSISIATMAICMMSLFGTFILLPIYMQQVLGLTALQTGLALLPGGLLMGLLGPVVGRLYDRVGPTVLLVPGAAIVSAVFWAMTLLDQNSSVWFVLGAHICLSVGLAFLFTPLFTASLSSVAPRYYSHGSAILGSIQQVAGAAGVALLVALMSIGTASLIGQGAEPVAAMAGGIRTAFFWGAVISLFAVVAAFFVRKPAEQPDGEMLHGH
ncbi:MAG: multidrug efflux transporter [Devosia sp.]|nr:multidrug efflux transporter [Devosia sp.]